LEERASGFLEKQILLKETIFIQHYI